MERRPCKVCVTGGASYIGSRLVKKLLEKDYIVHATLRSLSVLFLSLWILIVVCLFIYFKICINGKSNPLQRTPRQAFWEAFLKQTIDCYYLKQTYTGLMSLGLQFKAVNLSFTLLLPANIKRILRLISLYFVQINNINLT